MDKCVAFEMVDPKDALEHIQNNIEYIKKYVEEDYPHPLYTWDDGYRVLGKCKKCGAYILLQSSEYHAFDDGGDSYYKDYFPVENEEDAEELNRNYNGVTIERDLDRIWLAVTNGEVSWQNENRTMYVDIRDKEKRKEFVDEILEIEGMGLANSNNSPSFESAKNEVIESIYPIAINLEEVVLDYIKNNNSASAVMSCKERIVEPEKALEIVRKRLKNIEY